MSAFPQWQLPKHPAKFHFWRRSEPYDPYLPRNGTSSGPATAGPSQGNPKTAAIQAQIDDTVGIMRENITKVAERGERLEALQDKTGTYWMLHVWIGTWSCARSSAWQFVGTPGALSADACAQIISQFLRRASGAVQTVYAKYVDISWPFNCCSPCWPFLSEYVVSVNRINSGFQVSPLGGIVVQVERHEGALAQLIRN